MRLALLLSLTAHAVAAVLLVGLGAPKGLREPDGEPPGIAVIWSQGGGGEQAGETPAEPPPEAVQSTPDATSEPPPEPVEAAQQPPPPPPPPPSDTAVLPLPPPPPPAPPVPARIEPPDQPPAAPAPTGQAASPPSAGTEEPAPSAPTPSAGLLEASREATVGRRVDPVVPIEARLGRMQGTVVLAVTVSPEGVPSAVDVLRSSGHMLLDRAAQEALWQWRFDPARRAGVAVEERIAIPISFRITN